MKRILVATDGESGSHAVDQAIDLAQAGDAELTIVFVRHAPLPVLGDPYYQRALSDELLRGRDAVSIAAARARFAGVEAETELLEGDPATRILELARERDVDLIVVGSRGLGTIASTLLGSVSSRVVHRADRPVLVAARRYAPRRAA
jgi:nucleotide-binding universal stress UspA family protein